MLIVSALGLHLFTAITAYKLVAPGWWRYIAALSAWAFPAIAEAAVAVGAWRASGSIVNEYSIWVIGWLVLSFIVVAICKRLDRT